jgi:putative oxidoreductase
MSGITSPQPLSVKGIVAVRIIIAILLIVHGLQVFNRQEMLEYGPWMKDLGIPFPLVSAYIGKYIELAGGVALVLGVYMRLACILLMITFLVITIVMGQAKIFTDGQHPFLFFLFSMLFFFVGDSGYSVKRFWSR